MGLYLITLGFLISLRGLIINFRAILLTLGGFVTNLGCFSLIWGSFYVKLVFWESARPGRIFGPSRPGGILRPSRPGPEPNGRDFKHWLGGAMPSKKSVIFLFQQIFQCKNSRSFGSGPTWAENFSGPESTLYENSPRLYRADSQK